MGFRLQLKSMTSNDLERQFSAVSAFVCFANLLVDFFYISQSSVAT